MSSITLSLALRGRLLSGTQTTLQGALFGNNEPGFTFEPWDITTLYQDRAGTTPVTAAGQSVGLRLSKDQGLRLGAELVTNGDFASSSNWNPIGSNITITGGALVISGAANNSGYYQASTSYAGGAFEVAVVISSLAAGAVTATLGIPSPTGSNCFNMTAAGTYRFRQANFTADTNLRIYSVGASTTATIDSVSVKALAGNHEVAVSDAKRGVYGWMPKTGKRNLLTYTEQFDNAAWVKGELTISTDAAVSPDGTTTADKLVESVNNAGRGTYYNPTSSTAVALSQNVTFTTYLKAAERGFGGVTAVDGANNRYYLVANLSTGAEIASGFANGSTTVVSKSITNVGGGWYRLQVTLTSGGAGNAFMWSYPQDDATFSTSTTGNAIYQGNGTSGIYIWGAQLEVGSTATAYQRVASQYDITEAGVPICYYVQADGVDDAYVTPTITPNTDKVQVFAGVRKLSDSPQGHILGGNGNNSGQFETLSGGWMTAANRYGAGFSTDAVMQIDSPASFTPPRSDVLSWRFDTAGATGADKVKLNVSGISQTLSISGVPTQGNFGAFAHYIYSRAGTLLPFNGLDFGHAVRFGPNLDAATIARVEALIARNTPEVTL